MDNKKDDEYYINKVIENIDAIISYTKGIEYEEFADDEMLIDATMFRLVQMAENMNKITSEFKEKNKNIKWGLISGFRNGIVHDYGKTDYTIVYDIITTNIQELKEILLTSLKEF